MARRDPRPRFIDPRLPPLRAAVEAAYTAFERYGPGSDFCTFCYTLKEIEYITTTPVRDLNTDISRILLNEVGNHWENADVYRHYLPRLLAVMAPPESQSLYLPSHLAEVLLYHGFRDWPESEREAVLEFIYAVRPFVVLFDEDDRREWYHGLYCLETGEEFLLDEAADQ